MRVRVRRLGWSSEQGLGYLGGRYKHPSRSWASLLPEYMEKIYLNLIAASRRPPTHHRVEVADSDAHMDKADEESVCATSSHPSLRTIFSFVGPVANPRSHPLHPI